MHGTAPPILFQYYTQFVKKALQTKRAAEMPSPEAMRVARKFVERAVAAAGSKTNFFNEALKLQKEFTNASPEVRAILQQNPDFVKAYSSILHALHIGTGEASVKLQEAYDLLAKKGPELNKLRKQLAEKSDRLQRMFNLFRTQRQVYKQREAQNLSAFKAMLEKANKTLEEKVRETARKWFIGGTATGAGTIASIPLLRWLWPRGTSSPAPASSNPQPTDAADSILPLVLGSIAGGGGGALAGHFVGGDLGSMLGLILGGGLGALGGYSLGKKV